MGTLSIEYPWERTCQLLVSLITLLASRAKSLVSNAFEFLGEEIFLPLIYTKKDIAKVKLKRLEIDTSDDIGVGRQLRIRIEGLRELMYDPAHDATGLGLLAYPDKPILLPEEVRTIDEDATDEELFLLETVLLPSSSSTQTTNSGYFKIILKTTIDEDDPVYDDSSLFTYTHYIPYQNKYTYVENFSVAHFTNFYEGSIRKDVGVKFLFDFEINIVQAMDEIEIVIYYLRNYIKNAADNFDDISAGLVAAIIYDELYHRDIFDDRQDGINPFTLIEEILINRNSEANAFVGKRDLPDTDVTLGFAQVSISGVKARIEQGYIDELAISGYSDDPEQAIVAFLLDPRTAPIVVAATLHHLIAFINENNEGAWDANDYLQALAYFYSSGYGADGKILQNPEDGNEKINRIVRLEKIMNLQ